MAKTDISVTLKQISNISETCTFIKELHESETERYVKLLKRMFVNPVNLLTTKDNIEKLNLTLNILLEYKNVLENSNSNIDLVEFGYIKNYCLNNLKADFKNEYTEPAITGGFRIVEEYFPEQKLQAIKDFKEFVGNIGLRQSKAFVEKAFEYLKNYK